MILPAGAGPPPPSRARAGCHIAKMRRRWLVWVIVSVLAAAAVVTAGFFFELRADVLRTRIAATLSARFDADVTIEDLSITFLPRIRVTGSGLMLRLRDRHDLPPFLEIGRFWMDIGPFSVPRKHVSTVHLDGLRIRVPPQGAGRAFSRLTHGPDGETLEPSKVLIDRLTTHDAELAFVSSKPDKRPLVFKIEQLDLEQLGFDRPIPFKARLINPVPTGLVETTGSFGPWVKSDPAETPLKGRYEFTNADLSTIEGIRGRLDAAGTFSGRITAISVAGTTTTPDFNLEMGGHPLPLATKFAATVDGTNGTVVLDDIKATLQHSTINAKGAVVNLPGPGQHSIDLDVDVPKGRIEDLLAFVTRSKAPMAMGDTTLRAKVHLPPGHSSTLTRLAIKGQFALSRATFKDGVQARVKEFSRRTQGRSVEEMDASVASDVRGGFALTDGVLELRGLSFKVPGAAVALDGSGNLRTRALDLKGTLTMEASISEAVGGFKSIFLKLVDPFFRKKGQGTVLPIKIQGTIDEPKTSLNLRGK